MLNDTILSCSATNGEGGGIFNATGSTLTATAVGDTFTLIENDGTDAVLGTFQGLAEWATFKSNGATFKISYKGGTGNDVVLTRTA